MRRELKRKHLRCDEIAQIFLFVRVICCGRRKGKIKETNTHRKSVKITDVRACFVLKINQFSVSIWKRSNFAILPQSHRADFLTERDLSAFVNKLFAASHISETILSFSQSGRYGQRFVRCAVVADHFDDAVPNKKVAQEYVNAISTMDWSEVTRSVEASRKLLQSLWDMDVEAVAKGIDQAHDEISILQYNDERSLSCVIGLAFYSAKDYYTIVREMPSGKGFADIFLIPRPMHMDKPAVVIELKKNKDAQGAIDQIKQKNYVKALEDYKGDLLLVGINYDKDKNHTFVIEKWICK